MNTSKAIIVIREEVTVHRKRKEAAKVLGMTDNGLKMALRRNNNNYYRQDGTRVVVADVECPGRRYVSIKGKKDDNDNDINW